MQQCMNHLKMLIWSMTNYQQDERPRVTLLLSRIRLDVTAVRSNVSTHRSELAPFLLSFILKRVHSQHSLSGQLVLVVTFFCFFFLSLSFSFSFFCTLSFSFSLKANSPLVISLLLLLLLLLLLFNLPVCSSSCCKVSLLKVK